MQEERICFCALEAWHCMRHDEIIGGHTQHISKQAFHDAISVNSFRSSFFARYLAATWQMAVCEQKNKCNSVVSYQ